MIDATFAPAYFEAHKKQILDDYFTLIRFPTVGANPRHLGDCAKAVAWLMQFLKPLGFRTEALTPALNSGLPVPLLFAERPGAAGSPPSSSTATTMSSRRIPSRSGRRPPSSPRWSTDASTRAARRTTRDSSSVSSTV